MRTGQAPADSVVRYRSLCILVAVCCFVPFESARSQLGNFPPIITPIPPLTVDEEASLDYPVMAQDRDGDLITLTLVDAPPFVVLIPDPPVPGTSTGILRIRPGPNGAGGLPSKDWCFRVVATDNGGGNPLSSEINVCITVIRTNTTPTFTVLPPSEIAMPEGEVATFDLRATDLDTEQLLTFSLVDAPPFATVLTGPTVPGVGADGVLTLAPGPNSKGVYCFTVVVQDGEGGSDQTPVSVHVFAPCGSSALWNFATPVALTPPPPPQTGGSTCGGLTVVASNNTLTALRSESSVDGPAGSVAWSHTLPTTIQNFVGPVPLSFGGEYIFAGGDNGFLYKIDASTGGPAGISPYLKRPSCPNDAISTAAVQLYSFSNSQFQTGVGKDLVFVPTRHGCGSTTDNVVFALDAADLSIVWTFNQALALDVNSISEGCTVDYQNNQLYCGTDLATAITDHSLFAISTLNAGVAWSWNAGPIRNRPQLPYPPATGKLYVANADGTIYAIGRNDGIIQMFNQFSPAGTQLNMWAEFRGSSTQLFVTDTAGVLHSINDSGSSLDPMWSIPNVVTPPVASHTLGRVWTGMSDGSVWELDIDDGQMVTEVSDASDDPLTGLVLGQGDVPTLLAQTGRLFSYYCIPLGPEATAVDPTPVVPRALASIDRVAPNPFNPRTSIEYSLSQRARVQLTIHDVRGRVITRLVDRVEGSGPHVVEWDGRDASGHVAASGIYLVLLNADGTKSSRKLALIK